MKAVNKFFRLEFRYRPVVVDRFVYLAQIHSNTPRGIALRRLVFKMMKNVVMKNVANFINLLKNSGAVDIPEREEVVSECYLIFDKCLLGYKCNSGYNFYMYFNKSLSRNFFQNYKLTMKRESSITLTETITIVKNDMKISGVDNSVELLMENLRFTALEILISKSKMNGQRSEDFIKQHPEITMANYSKVLKSLKEKILKAKQEEEL